jgi:hypothetical protein
MRKVRYSLSELYVISVLIYSGGGRVKFITYFKGAGYKSLGTSGLRYALRLI